MRKEPTSHRLPPLADRVLALAGGAGDRMPVRAAVEHMIAVTYGMTYDVVVTRFRPYESMIEEIIALVTRSVPVTANPRSVKILDIACGIGNVGLRLARRGWAPRSAPSAGSCRPPASSGSVTATTAT